MKTAAIPFPEPDDESSQPEGRAAHTGAQMRDRILVGMNTTVSVARTRTPRERDAIIWLAAYARREQVPAESLCDQLAVDRTDIRAAFVRPDADLKVLLPRIESMRAMVEAALPTPAATRVHRDVTECLEYALTQGAITEYLGPTRSGKTESAEAFYRRRLHDTVYVLCPRSESYRDFIFAVATACGVGISGRKHLGLIEAQIKSLFGPRGLRLLIVDEGHRLWPTNLVSQEPRKIEFLRTLWDENKGAVGVAVLATPQYAVSMNLALDHSKRWAPGQWEGRAVRWTGAETMSSPDLGKVASHHYPDAPAEVVDQLVAGAKATQGLCGSMVNALKLARFRFKTEKPSLQQIIQAQAQMARGSRIEELARKGAA